MSSMLRGDLYLCGLMGAGKTTVGNEVARLAGCSFLDLDRSIEERAGATVAEIFRLQGEPVFRRLEGEAIRQLIENRAGRVIALGGGAMANLPEELFERLIRESVLVYLEAPVEDLAARVETSSQGGQRPVLGGLTGEELRDRLKGLLDTREALYRKASKIIASHGRSVTEVAQEVLATWRGEGA